MVTAPMMDKGLDVNLPQVKDAPDMVVKDEPLKVIIGPGGEIRIGKARVESIDKLGAVLTQATAGSKDRQVLLEADGKVPYGTGRRGDGGDSRRRHRKGRDGLAAGGVLEVTTGRYSRGNATLRQVADRRSQRENNFFLAIIGLSLLVHTIVATLFLYKPTNTTRRRPPTLYVDLVMAPVANPQRGSAGAIKKIAEPVAVAAPVAAAPQPVAPTKVAKEQVVVKGKETKKTAEVKDEGIAAAMAKMKQRKAEQDELKDTQAAIAAMGKKTAQATSAAAVVGSASGNRRRSGERHRRLAARCCQEEMELAGPQTERSECGGRNRVRCRGEAEQLPFHPLFEGFAF